MRIGLRLNAPSGSGSSWSANAPSLAEFSSTFNMLSRAVFLRRPRIFVLPSPTLRQAFHHTINNMSAIKKVVLTDKAPPPIKGVYNQAIVANGTVYCSGQIGTDPATGKIVEGDVQAHTVMNRVVLVECKSCEADTPSTKSSRTSPPSSRRQGLPSTTW